MRIRCFWLGLAALSVCWATLFAQHEPPVLGRGVGLFKVGELVAQDDFEDLENWVVQLEEREGYPEAHVEVRDRALDCLVPGRGCTIWFKQKFKTRVAITYDVICPTPELAIKGVEPRDINNFWMASDPIDLFDASRFTGEFSSYDKMLGYYASTGGGRNTTTRMRRYPREVDGKPAEHLALTDKDGQEEYLIKTDKVMRIQLVAYDDVIQYIVDGKLNYEITSGEPVYREGYFGFRMVNTHHRYTNFRVHALEPVRTQVTVSSIEELQEAVEKSHQEVVMTPGVYEVTDSAIHFSGSHNQVDLSGVTIRTPIRALSRMASKRHRGTVILSGDHLTLTGGSFLNTYPDNKLTVTDFGSYNQKPDNFPSRGATEMRIRGSDITVSDCKFIVRGSYPYGYGNMYGIGEGAVVDLKKHCGIQITGDRVTIDGCHLKMEAFGHAIFVQGGDQITVRNTVVEGEVRPSNDLYDETNEGDLAKKFEYKIQWPENVRGLPIPRDHMINLMEDGIRAYRGTGHMTVENCKVTKARGGIKLYMAKSATVSGCEVRDCVIQGYSLPSRGTLTNSSGNAAYGPLLYSHFDKHHSQEIDLQVLPSPHGLGDHPLAAINGRNHRITFTSSGIPDAPRPIIVGYPLRFDYLCVDYPKVPAGHEGHFAKFAPDSYVASNITIINQTHHPVVQGDLSEGNKITRRPNVILIMTDDQGYGDLSCHGNPILKTPHLDRLHAESIRFTDFHVSPFCTPTRAALMTGRHPGRTGAYRTSAGRSMMHPDEKTIANRFADSGYATGMVGKWHLGDNAPHRPQDRGFQDVVWHRCGGIGQASDYWGNDYFDDTYERNGRFEKFDGYCTDVWFREGKRFIESNKDKPFFLYLSLNAPHGPYHVPEEWSKPYQESATWRNGANFYGMVANIDHNVGLLRAQLEELGLAENTILVFMTDNGTAAGAQFEGLESEALAGFNAGMRGKKSSIYEGGHRVPFFIHWPKGDLIGGKDRETLAAHIDVLPTLAELCGVPVPETHHADGLSLVPLLNEPDHAWPRTHHVVQYHGGAGGQSPLGAFTHSVVMTERWRLVNSKEQELYDIQADPAQRRNVASEHPEVVAELRAAYEPFWKSVSPRLSPVHIDLGNPTDNPTVLSSQNWFMLQGNPPWNFGSIKRLPKITKPWMVDVKHAGWYRLTLRQWPAEANKPIVAVRAKVKIAGKELEKPVQKESQGVDFELELPAGRSELWTYLYDDQDNAGGAYFTEVEALESKAN